MLLGELHGSFRNVLGMIQAYTCFRVSFNGTSGEFERCCKEFHRSRGACGVLRRLRWLLIELRGLSGVFKGSTGLQMSFKVALDGF